MDEAVPTDHDRRRFVRNAVVGSAVAFAVPTIVTISPAGAADLTSAPPSGPDGVGPDVVNSGPVTQGAGVPGPEVKGVVTPGASPSVLSGSLANTGLEVTDLVAAGLSAAAGGSAILLWKADREQ